MKSSKPARPFGAPASDDEGRGEGDGKEDGNASENDKDKDKDDTKNQDAEEDKAAETEDKRKPKLHRGENDRQPNYGIPYVLTYDSGRG